MAGFDLPLLMRLQVVTYNVSHASFSGCFGYSKLSLRMRKLRHGSRTSKQRERHIIAEDLRTCINLPDVSHDPRSEPYTTEEVIVGPMGMTIGSRRGEEGPGLLREVFGGRVLEVLGVDNRAQRTPLVD